MVKVGRCQVAPGKGVVRIQLTGTLPGRHCRGVVHAVIIQAAQQVLCLPFIPGENRDVIQPVGEAKVHARLRRRFPGKS